MTWKNAAIYTMTMQPQTTITPPGETVTCTIVNPAPGAVAPLPALGTTKVKATGFEVVVEGDQIQVSAISTNIATIPDPGPYLADLTAQQAKVKAEGSDILTIDDRSATISATPQIPGSPPTNHPITFKCIVTDAGQDKAKINVVLS